MVKYEVCSGLHLNCSMTENWFAGFNGTTIPGLGRNAEGAKGGRGAIDAVIAVRSILGGRCDFKEAKAELQRMFLPHTLSDAYVPADAPLAPLPKAPPAEKIEVPKDLPARFDTAADYHRHTRGREYEPLARLPEDLIVHARRYLVLERKLPQNLVESLFARNAVYPSVRERWLKSRRTGNPYLFAEPMLVFPLKSWKEPIIVGFDYKTIPTDPAYASFGATEGRKQFGGYLVGQWNEGTRNVILTEAAIDSLSKWVLDSRRKTPASGGCPALGRMTFS